MLLLAVLRKKTFFRFSSANFTERKWKIYLTLQLQHSFWLFPVFPFKLLNSNIRSQTFFLGINFLCEIKKCHSNTKVLYSDDISKNLGSVALN